MEAVMRPFPRDQTLATNKQNRIKTPKRNTKSKFISNPSVGLLNPPPPPPPLHPHPHALYAFLLSSSSSYQQNHQPPLLPLPTASPIHHHPLLSPSPRNKKTTTRNMSLTPNKSKPTMRDIEVKKRTTQSLSEFLIPKHLPIVLTSSSSSRSTTMTCNGFGNENDIGMFSSSVFNVLSPPPSSLPLPKFCVRSKLSCNAKTGGGDARATQDLRQILRLQ